MGDRRRVRSHPARGVRPSWRRGQAATPQGRPARCQGSLRQRGAGNHEQGGRRREAGRRLRTRGVPQGPEMKVLVVGGGGREHALCWALRRDLRIGEVFCAPGNPGTAELATNLPIGAHDDAHLLDAAREHGIDLTIIGPEAPLARGLADRIRAAGLLVFGPSAGAARIQASKAFAKEVMTAAGIPTAASRTFSELNPALSYVDRHDEPLVVKASGLAAGKGAIVCGTRREAKHMLTAILRDG